MKVRYLVDQSAAVIAASYASSSTSSSFVRKSMDHGWKHMYGMLNDLRWAADGVSNILYAAVINLIGPHIDLFKETVLASWIAPITPLLRLIPKTDLQ